MTLCVALFLEHKPVFISDTLIASPEKTLNGKKTTIPSTAEEAGPVNIQNGVTHGVAGLEQKIIEVTPGTVMMYAGSRIVALLVADSLRKSGQGSSTHLRATIDKILSELFPDEVKSVDFLVYQHDTTGPSVIYKHGGSTFTHEVFGECWYGGTGSGETHIGLLEMEDDHSIAIRDFTQEDKPFEDFLNALVLCSKLFSIDTRNPDESVGIGFGGAYDIRMLENGKLAKPSVIFCLWECNYKNKSPQLNHRGITKQYFDSSGALHVIRLKSRTPGRTSDEFAVESAQHYVIPKAGSTDPMSVKQASNFDWEAACARYLIHHIDCLDLEGVARYIQLPEMFPCESMSKTILISHEDGVFTIKVAAQEILKRMDH